MVSLRSRSSGLLGGFSAQKQGPFFGGPALRAGSTRSRAVGCRPDGLSSLQSCKADTGGRTSLCNSNTRGEALRCRARRGLGRESLHKRCSDSPQGIGGCRVAPSTKPPHFPPRRETGRARLIVKSRIACRRPLYNTRAKRGYTGGKVRFPPVLQVQCVHQVQCTFPLVGSVHCAKPILRAENVGQVGLVGQVGRLAHGAVSAMCFCIFIAHGCVVCWLAWHIVQCRYCGQ